MCPRCDSVFRGEMLLSNTAKHALLSRTTSMLLHAWCQTRKAPVPPLNVTKRSQSALCGLWGHRNEH
jgi:uncharacterized C2H2 Zn-finger protein